MNRIRLEELHLNHYELLYAFELENKSYFASIGLGRPESYYDRSNFKIALNNLIAEQQEGKHLMFCIFNETNELVGRINLVDIHHSTGEVGYRIGEKHQNNGYATKSLSLLLKLAEDVNFTQISAGCDSGNIASQKVLINNGFKITKTIPIEEMYAGATESGLWFERFI